MMRLDGRVAVVTGSASGIGLATARLFAREGARVVAVDRDGAANADLVAGVAGAESHVVDLADRDAVMATALGIAEAHPRIDVLFNNAGEVAFGPAAGSTDSDWDAMVEPNLRAAFNLTRLLMPALRRSSAASVVNNASVDGLYAHPEAPLYSIAKAALVAMTRALAYELGADGIRINCIASGAIATPMLEAVPLGTVDAVARVTPLRRVGLPEEVASVALFLACEESSFVTGAVLPVDGGRTAITQGVLGLGR
jgi:NAD(P)-dependent dehydrogenase (short-subunit alcohol dehydrogenase family)